LQHGAIYRRRLVRWWRAGVWSRIMAAAQDAAVKMIDTFHCPRASAEPKTGAFTTGWILPDKTVRCAC